MKSPDTRPAGSCVRADGPPWDGDDCDPECPVCQGQGFVHGVTDPGRRTLCPIHWGSDDALTLRYALEPLRLWARLWAMRVGGLTLLGIRWWEDP